MKIAIVGTGAMGSVYAGLLGKAGHEVWAIDLRQEHIDAITGSGLASREPVAASSSTISMSDAPSPMREPVASS
jgi:2-dehydropantoate 2-reductase